MKRIWIAVAVLFVLAASCTAELISINSITNTLQNQISQAQSYVEEDNFEDAVKVSKDIHDNWEGKHKILAMFIQHSRLEDIDQSFAMLDSNIKCEETSDFFAEKSRISARLEHLKDTEMPTINNIL